MKKLIDLFFTFLNPKTEVEIISVSKPEQLEKKTVRKKSPAKKVVVDTTPKLRRKKYKDKKEELEDALLYMKAKKGKTKRDKESIYILEMVLKNMR